MSEYSFPTKGSVSRKSACGCTVGLLSDIAEVPENVRMHMGSLPNPWVVIHCKSHPPEDPSPEANAINTLLTELGESGYITAFWWNAKYKAFQVRLTDGDGDRYTEISEISVLDALRWAHAWAKDHPARNS